LGNSLDVTSQLKSFGFKSVNLFQLLYHATTGFGKLVEVFFAWVYFASELGVIIGALIFLFGSIGHHSGIKQAGGRTIMYSVIGFMAALLVPGLIIGAYGQFHG